MRLLVLCALLVAACCTTVPAPIHGEFPHDAGPAVQATGSEFPYVTGTLPPGWDAGQGGGGY